MLRLKILKPLSYVNAEFIFGLFRTCNQGIKMLLRLLNPTFNCIYLASFKV